MGLYPVVRGPQPGCRRSADSGRSNASSWRG